MLPRLLLLSLLLSTFVVGCGDPDAPPDGTEEVGSYGRCMERSRVLAEDGEVWLDVYIPEEDQRTSCGWAPLQVEVWQVPRDQA